MALPAPSVIRSRRLRGDLIAAGLFAAFIAWISIGDPHVRLANTILDDNPVVFAHFLTDSSLFTRDVLQTYGEVFGKATVQNWLAAFLLSRFGIDPHVLSIVFVYIQHVALAVALVALAMELTRSRTAAWATVFFAFGALPWQWNLAGYRSILPWPYPGHLVLPPLLFAFTAALRGRNWTAVVLLSVSSAIHPAMTLCAVAVVGLFHAIEWIENRQTSALVAAAALVIPVLACIGPPLLLTSGGGDVVSRGDMMEVLRANGHMNPKYRAGFLEVVLPSFAGFQLLAFLADRWSTHRSAPDQRPDHRARRLCIAAVLATLFLTVSHVIGMTVGIPRIAQIAGTRASVLLVVVWLPVVLWYLTVRLTVGPPAIRWAAAAVPILLAFQNFGLFVGPMLVLLLAEGTRGELTSGTPPSVNRSSAWLLVGWVVSIVAAGAVGALGGTTISGRPVLVLMAPGTYLGKDFVVAVLLISIGTMIPWAVQRWKPRASKAAASVALILVLGFLAVAESLSLRGLTSDRHAVGNFQAQRWARTHTTEDAVFLIVEEGLPWRTESLRNAVRVQPDAFYIYSGSREAKRLYYDKAKALLAMFPDDSIGRVLAFAEAYNVDFVVAPVGFELPLPVVYTNETLTVRIFKTDSVHPATPRRSSARHSRALGTSAR